MSLGKDLAAVRIKLELSLEEVQGQIKIPAHVLKSIENDSIFSEIETNKTYTRSFVRSYAKALRIPDELIVSALDSIEAGIYEPGMILDEELAKKHAPLIKPDVLDDSDEKSEPILIKPDIEEAPQKPTPTVENVNWADLGKRFSTPATNPKVVVPVIIALVIVIAAVLIFVFREPIFGLFSSNDDAAITDPIETNDSPLIANIIEDSSEVSSPELSTIDTNSETVVQAPSTISEQVSTFSNAISDTLTVTVYAAFDKLEPIRVTSDFNWRTNPFWMEQGQAYNFNFVDTLLVRGQYTRFLLMFNGHVIDDPFGNYYDDTFDSILLTRSVLNSEEYFVQPSSEFPYDVGAPDSLVFPLQN